jgi:site-specific DNA-cytosine methylase
VLTIGSLFSGVGGLERGLELAGLGPVLYQAEVNPYCRRVLRRHWPDAVLLDSVQKVRVGQVPSVDLVCGGFPCFPAGTLIDTSEGLRPIDELQVGDLVATHQHRLRPVVATMRREEAPLVEVRAMGAPPIRATPEHPFLARRRWYTWNPMEKRHEREFDAPSWVPAKDLTRNHFVAQLVRVGEAEGPWEPPTFWYLVGRWLGDGWIVDHRRKSRVPHGRRGSRINSQARKVVICAAHDEADELATHIAAAGFHATRATERTVVKFHISSRALVEFLAPFGRGAAGKHIPAFVYGAPLDRLAPLWRGYVDADGHFARDRSTRAATISRSLAVGMARVARIVTDAPVSLHFSKASPWTVIEGRRVRQRDRYEIRAGRSRHEGFHEAGFCWVPVREVRSLDERADVFNIEVEEDQSYVAESLVVHNCQNVSLAGNGQGLDGAQSGLWREFARVVRELRPSFVVVENVAALRRRGLDRVLGELAARGYDATWDCVPAAAVGAPHRRDRLFVVAWRVPHADRLVLRQQSERGKRSARSADQRHAEPRDVGSRSRGVADADRVDVDARRRRAGSVLGERSASPELRQRSEDGLGDADRERREGRAQRRERRSPRKSLPRARSEALAHADRWRRALERVAREWCERGAHARGHVVDGRDLPVWPPASDDVQAWRAVPPAAQPAVCGVADVVPDRLHRLRAVGNAVAPAVAEVVGHVVIDIARWLDAGPRS